VQDPQGYTLLGQAIVKGRLETALALIEAGVDVRRLFRNDTDALKAAATYGDARLVKRLLAAGADAKSHDALLGDTALSLAVSRKRPLEVIEALIDGGSDVNFQRSDSKTPLILALQGGLCELVPVLLRAGARLDVADANGQTPLTYSVKPPARMECLEALLAAGAEVNAHDRWGSTALMQAAAGRNREAVRRLLAANADVNARAADDSTALMYAIYQAPSDTELVAILLAAKADVNASRKDGSTALMAAAYTGATPAAAALLQHGAKLDATDKQGKTALDYAKERDRAEVVRLLTAATAQRP
jgi:ankyrin repeat protein